MLLSLAFISPVRSETPLDQLRRQRDQQFKLLDSDGDGALTEPEYLAGEGPADVRRRDFHLFDFSGDGSLTPFEFAGIPVDNSRSMRGSIPDPFEGLLLQAIDALDESYDRWDRRPGEKMNSTFFAINFSASLATDGRRRLDREIVSLADPNGDHLVSREEAKRFLEIQLGISWKDGERLRLLDGRVVNFARFLRSDANLNERLSEQEFVTNWWRPETAAADFAALDGNGDKQLTLAEFARQDGPNILDPVQTFRQADSNLDGLLDQQELAAATPDYRANLVSSTIPAFDEDDDGKLSLNEYRLSMLGNFNYPWNAMIKDSNSDHRLSYDEFVFMSERDLFQLQRRLYFHRLDRSGDGLLTPDEFEFKGKPVQSLVLVDLQTGESRELFRSREFPSCGSPSISPDGETIAFDAAPASGISKTRIMTIGPDGTGLKDLCAGLMPTWSSDGKQFACSRYEGGSGVWIMNADGTPVKRISDGWGAQWSPDGKSIAFTNSNQLCVYDVESEAIRVVLDKNDHPYQYIFWNMSWSPDSKRMAFKGRLTNAQELAIVNMTGDPELDRRFDANKYLSADLAWTPDGEKLVFSMYSADGNRNQIYQLDPDTREPPTLYPGLPQDVAWSVMVLSPDGRWAVLASSE